MKNSIPVIAALLLVGCVTPAADGTSPVDRAVGEGGTCNTDGTERFVGQTATAQIGGDIQRVTTADVFQWVPPDSAVTMDYRPDRVRVGYDREMRITQITCG